MPVAADTRTSRYLRMSEKDRHPRNKGTAKRGLQLETIATV
jgi:hypothetical protein